MCFTVRIWLIIWKVYLTLLSSFLNMIYETRCMTCKWQRPKHLRQNLRKLSHSIYIPSDFVGKADTWPFSLVLPLIFVSTSNESLSGGLKDEYLWRSCTNRKKGLHDRFLCFKPLGKLCTRDVIMTIVFKVRIIPDEANKSAWKLSVAQLTLFVYVLFSNHCHTWFLRWENT